jgi:glutamine synthetase
MQGMITQDALQVVTAPCADVVKGAWQVYAILDAARQLADARGLHVTAAPKPLAEYSGNGLHVHMSVVHQERETSHAAAPIDTLTGMESPQK